MNELEIRTEIQEEHASPLDTQPTPQEQKFCKHCGQRIAKDAVICVHCGRQVEELGTKGKEQPNIVITNTNTNANTNTVHVAAGALKKEKNKRLLPIRKHREERVNGIASAVPFSHFSIDAVTFDISKAPMPL